MTTTPNPGFKPLEYYVVVLPEELEEKTAGGILIPRKNEDETAVQRGTLISLSPHAFTFVENDEHVPAVGAKVLFGRHAGTLQTGADGKKYRLIRDKDVIAVIEEAE